MAVAPVEPYAVVAHGGDVETMDVVRYARWIQAFFMGPLIDTHGARTLLPQVSKKVRAHVPVVPGDGQLGWAGRFDVEGPAAGDFRLAVILNADLCGEQFSNVSVRCC